LIRKTAKGKPIPLETVLVIQDAIDPPKETNPE
jgi:hypothetical protein